MIRRKWSRNRALRAAGRLGVLERREEVRLVVARPEAEHAEHVPAALLHRPEEAQLERLRRMSVQVQHGEEDVERLVRAGREPAEGAGEVPARGPSAMLVEAIGGDRGLEELDDVVDVRALTEHRQRVGVPLLGDGVRAAPVVKVGELVERPGIAPEEELASLVERGVGGAHDPQLRDRLAVVGLRVEPEAQVLFQLVPHVGQGLSQRLGVAPLDGEADLPPDDGCHQGGQRLGAPHRALRAPHGGGRDPLADVLPVSTDTLEPCRHLELEHGLDVLPDQAVARLGIAFRRQPRALELEQDRLVDGQRDLGGDRPPGGADECRQGGADGAHVGVPPPAPGHLVGHEDAHRVPEDLAHRPGRVQQRTGPTEQLVRRLKEAERLAEVAVAGGAAPEHVEGEAECREVPAPGAVPDLRGAGGVALQDLYGGAVLLEVLGR